MEIHKNTRKWVQAKRKAEQLGLSFDRTREEIYKLLQEEDYSWNDKAGTWVHSELKNILLPAIKVSALSERELKKIVNIIESHLDEIASACRLCYVRQERCDEDLPNGQNAYITKLGFRRKEVNADDKSSERQGTTKSPGGEKAETV